MAKRSNFDKKNDRGFYPTPPEAIAPLRAYLPDGVKYWEPCAGDGAIVRELPGCVVASDIKPLRRTYRTLSATKIGAFGVENSGAEMFITNFPWPTQSGQKGEPTLSLALHLSGLLPTWSILPWDFAANLYFSKIRDRCVRIVPIGRVSWEGNGTPGKDNCAWYLFDANHTQGPTIEARAA